MVGVAIASLSSGAHPIGWSGVSCGAYLDADRAAEARSADVAAANHKEVLLLQSMIPPKKRFDIFFPLTEGCSEGLDAFRFCGTLPKTQGGLFFCFLRKNGNRFSCLSGSADFPSGRDSKHS